MEFTQILPIFRIFDETRAREFYIDFLGFEIEFEHRFSEKAPLFHVSEHSGDATPGAAVFIEMTDLREYHARLASKDYKYYSPGIKDSGFGTVEMGILDPFHNRLSFNERISADE